ncbi:2'-5' RNA ligase family protein [Mesorhizobium sp. WSM4884]|uniref:2'-5' RNA ligase family protein n=1 Tax=Mesorhizobium sp. WSM4884 TaxID=3038542 RepID=UPI002415A09B|nr:2'-5' RNA ligase family protein [Mesorhizobium sp. WSM4884]MDG4880599.1 2'-5' RNA ligase family protein [Mesorhizobium sp. WSM4884]
MNGQLTFGTQENGQTYFGWGELKASGKRRRTNEPHMFYGILVGEPTGTLLEQWARGCRQEFGLRQAWLTPAKQTHITLMGLGDGKSPYVVETACRVGSLIQAKPFDVCFDRLSAFGGGALVLRSGDRSPALQEFWRKLSAVVHDSPLQPFVTNSLEPHVTLLRDRDGVPKIPERLVDPVRWTVRSFALIHSCEGKYEFPGFWRLSGRDDAHAVM